VCKDDRATFLYDEKDARSDSVSACEIFVISRRELGVRFSTFEVVKSLVSMRIEVWIKNYRE